MDEIIVYSVNIGNYDSIVTPKIYDKNVRYILFSDNKNIKSDVWEVMSVDTSEKFKNNKEKSRFFKLNAHKVLPKHNISIYLDGNIEPKFDDTKKLIEDIKFEDFDIMCYFHFERNCTYQEANEVLKLKLESLEIIDRQIQRYTNMGFPKNFGLTENGFLLRKNNDKIKRFNEFWWDEVKNNSTRDQLSFMFSCWYNDVNLGLIKKGKNIRDNDYLLPLKRHNVREII